MPEPLDHVGWSLWRAAQAWKSRFSETMVARGHLWFGEARANLIHLIGPKGVKQSVLAARSQLTKQAVQQFLDELEADGIVMRVPDPDDARGRLVQFTAKGKQALKDADWAKRKIEADYEALIGRAGLERLKSALDKIADASE